MTPEDLDPEERVAHGLTMAILGGLQAKQKYRKAAVDPWGGATLEWRTATPPPVPNFEGEPELARGPYDYPVEVDDE